MKLMWKMLVLSLALTGLANVSQAARVHVWLGIRPFPLVVAPEVVVAPAPVAVADPYAAPPTDYRAVLENFHTRVKRLQRMLDRQLNRGVISQALYDRHANDLDAILRDEQTDAARHNGALTPREVNDLDHRLTDLQERVHEDLAR